MIEMPTTVSQDELDQLMVLVNEHREQTGESVTALAERSGVERTQLSRLMSGSYPHGPQFEMVAKLAHAIGRKIAFPPA